MNEQRPTPEQPKPWTAPRATPEKTATTVPAKPPVAAPQPARPDVLGGPNRPVDPKQPAPISTQGKR
jgi:hypothetical protein